MAARSADGSLPKIRQISPLSPDEAKWTKLNKIEWTDQTNRDRIWESCSRTTRSSGGIDAVAIAPIVLHPSAPPSTLVILQYRPPVNAVCVEFPAGLIDKGETPEQAAVRELKEETGYAGVVREVSPVIVSDPGLSDANMKMVTIEVQLKEGDKEPQQHLDEGEFIERRVVPLAELFERLQAFSKENGVIVDARLYHWALGLHWSKKIADLAKRANM